MADGTLPTLQAEMAPWRNMVGGRTGAARHSMAGERQPAFSPLDRRPADRLAEPASNDMVELRWSGRMGGGW